MLRKGNEVGEENMKQKLEEGPCTNWGWQCDFNEEIDPLNSAVLRWERMTLKTGLVLTNQQPYKLC